MVAGVAGCGIVLLFFRFPKKMPFTLAHPAAVIPVYRLAGRWGVLLALVIGSMAPDFVYFLPIGVTGGYSHSIVGAFLFCVPAGLFAYMIFQSLLRKPLLALLPDPIANRVSFSPEWIPRTPQAIVALVVSLAVGAITHIAWDSFTHANTFLVRHLDLLRHPVEIGTTFQVPMYKFLQHVSTLAGLAALTVCIAKWVRRAPPILQKRPRLEMKYRLAIIGMFLAAGMSGFAWRMAASKGRIFERVLFEAVVGGIVGMALAVLVFCVGWWLFVGRFEHHS
jgi:hypothetical protein